MTQENNDSKRYWAMIVGAILVTVGLSNTPYIHHILWPFTILGTWVHEMGHGLMAKLWGHEFMHLEIDWDGSGVAFHRGRSGRIGRAMIAAAGLLGPAFAGSLLILFGKKEKNARKILQVLGALMTLSLIFYVRKNWCGYTMISLWTAALFATTTYASDKMCYFFVQFIGLQFCINNFKDFDYMFIENFRSRGGEVMLSDTGNIAKNLLLPYWFWGALIALSSLAMLGGSLWFANAKGERPSVGGPKKISPKKVDDILSELS